VCDAPQESAFIIFNIDLLINTLMLLIKFPNIKNPGDLDLCKKLLSQFTTSSYSVMVLEKQFVSD